MFAIGGSRLEIGGSKLEIGGSLRGIAGGTARGAPVGLVERGGQASFVGLRCHGSSWDRAKGA
ncbi:MAG TPA: hypothetical protein VK871_07620 [Candidatus Limnocylindrales bacterium]|nr:hypothetical protein [Candidatus Limnocylindrales bacterium]